MRSQLTVRLPRELSQRLSAAARRSGTKPSEIVRAALRAYLEPRPKPTGTPYDRMKHLIGSIDSGISDLAERHSEYVLESLKRGR
jgi:metal-responsive CopG/Arc/MetJ family transcriptional regulator